MKWSPDWRLVRSLLFVWAVAVVISIAVGAEKQTPQARGDTSAESVMVSGFERFARHGEISNQIAGSLLISELSCVGCHASDDDWLQPKRGPRLDGAGHRLQPAWVRGYLANPQESKAGTTMPHVLASLSETERDEAIDALTAFLGTQLRPFPEIKAGGAAPVVHEFWKRGDSRRGARLYHSIGCVACHEPDAEYETLESKPSPIDAMIEQLDPEQLTELGLAGAARRVESVPLGELDVKYSLRSLTMMLLDPAKTRPAGRMPSLRLTPAEAADIAAYLFGEKVARIADISPDEPPQQLIARGRTLFVELRCANCHAAADVGEPRLAGPLPGLDPKARASCIENPTGDMPRYHLDDMQRSRLRSALSRGEESNRTAVAHVAYRMLQLNCYACHQRDGLGGVGRYRKAYFETVGHVDLGDEGRLPPRLAHVGRKLLPETLAAVFHPSTRPHRPYMTIRMPTYEAAIVESLVAHLPEADEVDKSMEDEVFTKVQASAEVGRDLVNTGCVECHPFRGESLPGVVGIDLDGITDRVYPTWFHDFVRDPGALKERTRMPTFFPDGESYRKDLLGGDVHQQISAAWFYLKNLDREPLPEKIGIARSANYELVPKEKPIVLRTFMEVAGTHAIAVGFPQGAHYAFDAEQVRIADGWKGRFLDARGTWFERFTPPAEPLGEQHVRFPSGPLLQADDSREYQFGGYRLDAAGVPTLLYRYGDWSIEDRVEATEEGGLKRTVTVQVPTGSTNVKLRPLAARELNPVGAAAYADDQGLAVALPERIARDGFVRQTDEGYEWLVPLTVEKKKTIVLEYRW